MHVSFFVVVVVIIIILFLFVCYYLMSSFSLPFECLTSHTLSVCLCIHVYHSLAHYLLRLSV